MGKEKLAYAGFTCSAIAITSIITIVSSVSAFGTNKAEPILTFFVLFAPLGVVLCWRAFLGAGKGDSHYFAIAGLILGGLLTFTFTKRAIKQKTFFVDFAPHSRALHEKANSGDGDPNVNLNEDQ